MKSKFIVKEWQEFLEKNNLKQVDVARYLNVTKCIISNYVHGNYKPSKQQREKLLANKEWDTTMLLGQETLTAIGGKRAGKESLPVEFDKEKFRRETAREIMNTLIKTSSVHGVPPDPDFLCKKAVMYADQLIKHLEK